MKRVRHIVGRTGLLFIEGVAVLGVIFALLLGAATWRLQNGPIDLNFAKEYLAESLSDEQNGLHATLGEAVLYWPDLAGPLFVGIKNIQMTNDKGQKLAEIGEAAIGLSRTRLLIGKIAPTALIIKKPGLRVVRREDNTLDFGFAASPQASEGQGDLLDKLVQFVAHPGDEASSSSRFYRLRALSIEDATIMVEDHVLGVSWFAQGFNLSMKSDRRGLEAGFQFSLPGSDGENSDIGATAKYDWESKILDFGANLTNFNLQFLTSRLPELGFVNGTNLPLSGTLAGHFSKTGGLEDLKLSMAAPEGKIRVPAVRDAPLTYKNIALDASYTKITQTLDITKLALELENIPLRAHGSLKLGLAGDGLPNKAEGSLEAVIPSLDHSQIVALWPEALKNDSSREWFVEKIKSGQYTNLTATTTLQAENTADGWHVALPALTAAFEFTGTDVNYHAPLTPVTNGSGSGVFDLAQDTLTVDITGGTMDDLTIESGKLAFTTIIAKGRGHLVMTAKVAGPLKGFLTYAEKDPINLTDQLDFDVQKVKGDAAIDVMLDFPTRKDVLLSEFKIDVKGTINNSFIPAAVGKADLTGGPLTLKADQENAVIEGKALLGGQAITLKREGFLRSAGKPYKSKTTASLITTPALRTALGIDLSDFIDGSAGVNLQQTQYTDGKATADITVDLTPGRFFLEPFGYEKPAGAKGSATMTALLQDDTLKEIKNLTAQTDQLKLEPSRLTFKESGGKTIVETASIPGFSLNETRANIEMQRGPKDQMKIVLKGPFLDARSFLASNETPAPEAQPARLISVAVDNMRTADDQTVQNAKIYADIDAEGAFDQFEVDAIAGKGAVYLRFKPDTSGKRRFEFEADDAGAALKAFGVYDKIVGGTIKVQSDPIEGPNDRNLAGKAVLQNFRVVKAPALARLIGALSVPGLLELLGNDGLAFSKLESDFTWTYKKGGSLITLADGRTSGNSLGLTFEGTIDRATSIMQIEGTIIPLSTVNKIVGSIPLIGDLITGGTGSVFAATYSMRGKTEDPDVMVNPLSVLTPGILRRILFE
jgi:hypothetical protein